MKGRNKCERNSPNKANSAYYLAALHTQRKHWPSQCLPVLVLIKLSIQIQLKVCRTQCYHDLPLVRRRPYNRLSLGHPPLVDTSIDKDMSDALSMHLQESIGADLLHREGGRGGEKACILNFLTDGEQSVPLTNERTMYKLYESKNT